MINEYSFHLLSNEAIFCQIVSSVPISHLGNNAKEFNFIIFMEPDYWDWVIEEATVEYVFSVDS